MLICLLSVICHINLIIDRVLVVSTTVYTPNNEDMLDEGVDGCYDEDQHHDNAQQVNRAMRLERRNRLKEALSP